MTRNNLEIRLATLDDLEKISELERFSFAHPWSRSQFGEDLLHDYARLYVATEDVETVGYADVHIVCGDAHLNTIAVLPEKRGQGIGEALISKCLDEAERMSATVFSLEVRESNTPAILLYKKCGFEPVGRRRGFYTAPVEDGIIMLRNMEK